MTDQGHFVVVDAIDGAGKTTAFNAMAEWLRAKGHRLFDLVAFQKEHHRLPELEEIGEADAFLSAEPTFCWTGSAIREEIIRSNSGRTYSGRTTAIAFSLDRHILFSRVILPFLRAKPGRWVLQDRGVISSLAYQPLQDEQVTLEWLQTLEGNALELSRPPERLLLLRVAPDIALARISKREATDEGRQIYENASFQEKLAARYRDPEVLAPYTKGGTTVVEIDATQTPEEVGHALTVELEKLTGA